MSEVNQQKTNQNKQDTNKGAANTVARSIYGKKSFNKRGGGRFEKKDEFEQRILDIARVTRVMAGGKRMRFRTCVAVGDRKGKIGVGIGKGIDVTLAANKAVNEAKKNMVDVPIINDTIPHEVFHKFSAAKILFKPTKKGRGVIAGSVVRVILELAGIKNITSKILGTGNKVSNAKCTIEALRSLRNVDAKSKEQKTNNPSASPRTDKEQKKNNVEENEKKNK